MTPQQDDAQQISKAQAGSRRAFGQLYERHLAAIYQYIYYRLGSHEDAEDLTEMVFLKAWQGLPRYRHGEVPWRAWLYRIAHNLVVDHYRQSRPAAAELPEELAAAVPAPEALLVEQEKADVVAAAIRALAPSHQHVLVLRFVQGLSPPEAAAVLERSHGAVRVLQHRALQALALQLRARGIDHE